MDAFFNQKFWGFQITLDVLSNLEVGFLRALSVIFMETLLTEVTVTAENSPESVTAVQAV